MYRFPVLFGLSILALLGCSPSDDHTSTSSSTSSVSSISTTTSTPTVQSDRDGDGYTKEDGDCDDENALIHPAAVDLVGDKIDMNCDGIDGVDNDQDGYASAASGGEDCNDEDALINPDALEGVCNGIDDDCNGLPDDGATCDVEVRHNPDMNCGSYQHGYLFLDYNTAGTKSWEEAEKYCESVGYDLLVVEDECEWSWIEDITAQYLYQNLSALDDWWTALHCYDGDCFDSKAFTWGDIGLGYTEWSGTTFMYGEECAYLLRYESDEFGLLATAQPCASSAVQTICETR
jgi:hypothetical protein